MDKEGFTVREIEVIKMMVDEHCKNTDFGFDGICFTQASLVIDGDEWGALNSLQEKLKNNRTGVLE